MSGLRLRSVESAPNALPQWTVILDDLGRPDAFAVAKVLGVDPVFVDDWNTRGSAPKWACLALFWLTSWGQASVYEKAERDCQLALQLAGALERERDRLLSDLGKPPEPSLLGLPPVWRPPAFPHLNQAAVSKARRRRD